ncbi:MAG: flavodoxin-dependent (E)-4-hydroxy-3-methylbut-2-enyl-diphosphate synthase, partial [bacterium]
VCGRCRVDLESIAREVRSKLPETSQKLVVAVMGCEVNGPGEAENADIGIAGGKEDFLLFKHGKPAGKIPQKDAVQILRAEIVNLLEKSKT